MARPRPHSNTAATAASSNTAANSNTADPQANTAEAHSTAKVQANTAEPNSTANPKANTAPRQDTADSRRTSRQATAGPAATAHKVSPQHVYLDEEDEVEANTPTAGYGGPAQSHGAQGYYGGPQNYDSHQHNQYGGAPQYPPPGQAGGYGGHQGGHPSQPGW